MMPITLCLLKVIRVIRSIGRRNQFCRACCIGHVVFVYIHPYVDGNGRIGRFLMNTMLTVGGCSWTVVPVGKRRHYMAALEQASVEKNIVPFAQFIGGLVEGGQS
jgi:fido (protein-threonine AMPylation protein)